MIKNPLNVKLGVKGHFKLVKGNGDTGEEKVVADFDNLITNAGLDMILRGDQLTAYCSVGTGTTMPAVGDTALQSRFATTSTSGGAATYSTDIINLTKTYTTIKRFAVGTFNSTIISEIGMGNTNSSPRTVGSRALILDEEGNPTTLTLLSTEYLKVYYTITLQAPTTDITGTFEMGSLGTIGYTARVGKWSSVSSPESYDFGGRLWNTPSSLDFSMSATFAAPSELGGVTGYPTGVSSTGSPYGIIQSYVDGNFYRDMYFIFPQNSYNSTPNRNIASIALGIFSLDNVSFTSNLNAGGFQILFDPSITKLYTPNELYCSFTLKIRITIARV